MHVSELEGSKLRKIEANVHLKISLGIIYYVGTWPPRENFQYFYIVYTAFSVAFILGIFLTTEIANIFVNWNDPGKIMAGATILMTNCTHAFKVLIILYRQKRIQALLDVTKGALFSRNNIEYERIVTYYTWQGIFHHIAYQSFGTIAVLCWGFTPIADLLAGRTRQLPMEGWYPYNVTDTPAFEITSLHQIVAIIIACFHNVAMDTLVTGLITVACCQFTLLNHNIASIKNEAKYNQNKGIVGKNSDEPYEELKLCVKHSNEIYSFSNEIQEIFGSVIFLQFLVNCIIICLIAFNITQMKVYVPSVLIGMLMYMCCMTYQIFIYCWHGNELHLHSISVLFAAYSNDWWFANKRFKQALQFAMTRIQRPLTLSAGNVMLLSLHTFVRILRMSYSIFTVLQSSTSS